MSVECSVTNGASVSCVSSTAQEGQKDFKSHESGGTGANLCSGLDKADVLTSSQQLQLSAIDQASQHSNMEGDPRGS